MIAAQVMCPRIQRGIGRAIRNLTRLAKQACNRRAKGYEIELSFTEQGRECAQAIHLRCEYATRSVPIGARYHGAPRNPSRVDDAVQRTKPGFRRLKDLPHHRRVGYVCR